VQDDDLKNDFLGLLCNKWGKSSAEQWSMNSDQLGRLRFVVSHSSTIKLWMNGAQRFLVFHDRATCLCKIMRTKKFPAKSSRIRSYVTFQPLRAEKRREEHVPGR
jgi:hypothetical protein